MKKGTGSLIQSIGLVALASFFLVSCEDKTTTVSPVVRPVKAIMVGEGTAMTKRSFPGRAQAVQEADLSFKVAGLLIDRPIKVGDVVNQGQLIAQLDSREFDARLKSAQAELKRDEENFRRAQQLITRGNISNTDFELLKTKSTIAKTNVDIAQKALSDTVIRAPFKGRIASISVENYQTIFANQAVARLLDTSYIEMVIQIPETIISVIPLVKDITVQFDAFPSLLIAAQVKEISNEASTQTRTYPVTLIMKQSDTVEILPGMAGNATVYLVNPGKVDKTQLTIPEAAVFSIGPEKNTYVWVVDKKSQKVHQHLVTLGELTGKGISIIEGLNTGDLVVTAGVNSLQEGDMVTLLNPQDE